MAGLMVTGTLPTLGLGDSQRHLLRSRSSFRNDVIASPVHASSSSRFAASSTRSPPLAVVVEVQPKGGSRVGSGASGADGPTGVTAAVLASHAPSSSTKSAAAAATSYAAADAAVVATGTTGSGHAPAAHDRRHGPATLAFGGSTRLNQTATRTPDSAVPASAATAGSAKPPITVVLSPHTSAFLEKRAAGASSVDSEDGCVVEDLDATLGGNSNGALANDAADVPFYIPPPPSAPPVVPPPPQRAPPGMG